MFLCIGTTPTVQRTMTFARLAVDDVNRAAGVREYASGKAVNVGRVLRELGREALVVGFAGGRRGAFLLEELAREGIAAEFVETAAQTRLCTTVIDRATGAVTELVEEAPAATADEWGRLVEVIDRHAQDAEGIIFSGTVAGGAPAEWPARWLGADDRLIVVDAKGEPLRRALAAGGRVIAKLNQAEFEQTLGRTFETEAALADAIRAHAPAGGALIVTMGKVGAIGCANGESWCVRPPKVEVVSPIGSGDAFAAGLAAGWGEGVAAALTLASACGAANALTPDSGYLWRADVERLVRDVSVERA